MKYLYILLLFLAVYVVNSERNEIPEDKYKFHFNG